MFDLPNDVVATAVGTYSPNFKIEIGILDPVQGKSSFGAVPTVVEYPQYVNSIALADFTGDAYADLVVNFRDSFGRNAIILATAEDVNNFDAGLRWGDDNDQTDEIGEMVVGDFDGDGQLEVFGLIPGADGTGLRLVLHTIDPSCMPNSPCMRFHDAVHFPLSLPVGSNSVIASFRLAAGRFGTTTHDQLAVVYVTDTQKFVVLGIDVDSEHRPIVKGYAVASEAGEEVADTRIASARFDWFGSFDQLAIVQRKISGYLDLNLWAFSSDGKLTPTAVGGKGVFVSGCPSDMAVGNFDRMQKNPNPPPDREHNPNLQLAILSSDELASPISAGCRFTADNAAVQIFNVSKNADAPGFTISPEPNSTFKVPGLLSPLSTIAAGDLQGRSLQLGAPTKVTVESHAQPSVVLGAPPMHVDYISPVGSSDSTVLNLSTIPSDYFTQYQAEETKKDQSSNEHTTSWSAGLKEEVGAKITFGNPKVDGGTAEVKVAAQQTWEGSTKTTNESYSKRTFDVSQQTDLGDQVWFTESRFNLYIYPVIGQRVCPDDGSPGSDCPDSAKKPLFVQFSGPDHIHSETIFGPNLEWYQPPWEPGNVFSSPASEAQLKTLYPDTDILASDDTWFTDRSKLVEKTSWESGTSQSQSTSSKATFAEEVSTSIAGQVSVVGGAIGGSFSLSGAVSNSTAALNTHQTSIGKSDGIGVQKPGSFADPTFYQYAVTPYLFGQTPPKGNVNDQPAPPTDIKTFGILRAAFLADPTDTHAGGWWQQAYRDKPDVALNHPARWQIMTKPLADPRPSNCLDDSSGTMRCATLAMADPSNPWLSPFHYMRGLFITNDGAKGQGPQLETATEGDKLVLQARVYNYSFAAMPEGTTVHVRFYGQPVDSAKKPIGGSFLIWEDNQLGLIPPFSHDGPLNWLLAHVAFDTTGYGMKILPRTSRNLTFWVIVWMEDSSGQLVPEIDGHGLTAVPGTLTSLEDADKIRDSYSNNVGFYKSAFYVSPPPSATSEPPAQGQEFSLGAVLVSAPQVSQGESVTVSTTLVAEDGNVPGTTVLFYDGDPQAGGTLFDLERVTYLEATEPHAVSVLFTPTACGEHTVFVVAARGTPFVQKASSDTITVDCSP